MTNANELNLDGKYTLRISYTSGKVALNATNNKREAASDARYFCDGSHPEISSIRVIDNKTGKDICHYRQGGTRAWCVTAPQF
jgi:hypothetical protein